MTIITHYEELAIEVTPEPDVHRTTAWRRRRRLEDLAWQEFANGGHQTTPRSAMHRAMNRYLPDIGRWIKSCAVCQEPFVAARADAVTCSERCRSAAFRKRRRG